jgi:hypothetical protein
MESTEGAVGVAGGRQLADGGDAPASAGEGPLFEECQRLRGRGTLVGTAVLALLPAAGAILLWPDAVAATTLAVVAVVVPLFVAVAALRTTVDEDGVHVRFAPLHRRPRVVRFDEVTGVERVSVRALADYGGVGIRRDAHSWAYLVASGDALRLSREDRPDVVVGSARPAEFYRAVEAGYPGPGTAE